MRDVLRVSGRVEGQRTPSKDECLRRFAAVFCDWWFTLSPAEQERRLELDAEQRAERGRTAEQSRLRRAS